MIKWLMSSPRDRAGATGVEEREREREGKNVKTQQPDTTCLAPIGPGEDIRIRRSRKVHFRGSAVTGFSSSRQGIRR